MYKHPLSFFFCSTHIKVECEMPSFQSLHTLSGLKVERNGCEWSNDRENDSREIEISILWTMPALLLKRHWLLMGLESHARESEVWVILAVETPNTDGTKTQTLWRWKLPQGLGINHKVKVSPDPSFQQTVWTSSAQDITGGFRH